MSNKSELYARAQELNIPGRSKMTVPQLEIAIANALAEHGPVLMDRTPVEVTNVTEVRVATAIRDELKFVENYGQGKPRLGRRQRNNTPRKIVKFLRAMNSMRYGMRSRGKGAKHVMTPRQMDAATKKAARSGGDWAANSDALKPLSYFDRVKHYAKQNGQDMTRVGESFENVALLTDKQWRRAIKKQRHSPALPRTGSPYKATRY